MIKQITIRNFQSHEATTLDLDPGVNIIVGQSDCGKTAIIRALRWLASNRPSGDAMRSRWGGDTEVEVHLGEDKIVRFKSKAKSKKNPDAKGENGYELWTGLGMAGGEMKSFAALGTEVPESVTKALNLSELNWQTQMDAPFLLSSSSGEVARALNEVADLGGIDIALQNINRMIRENKAAIDAELQEVASIEVELKQFDDVDDLRNKVLRLKDLDRKATLIENMIELGEKLIRNEDIVRTALTDFPDFKLIEARVTKIENLVEVLNSIDEQVLAGARMIDQQRHYQGRLKDIRIDDKIEARLEAIEKASEKLTKVEQQHSSLWQKWQLLKGGRGRLADIDELISGYEAEWKKSFPAVCPLCGKGS